MNTMLLLLILLSVFMTDVMIFILLVGLRMRLDHISASVDSIDGWAECIDKNTTAPPSDWHGS